MLTSLDEIRAQAADQERGTWFDLLDPVEGRPTGIRLRVAGPDSETQRKARLVLADQLVELADLDGRVSAEAREKVRQESLAACVLDWECAEDGQPLSFTTANMLRLIRAASWVDAQLDGFAGDRVAHWRRS